MAVFLGIDWGGTNLKVGVVSSAGKLIKKFVYSSPSFREKGAFISKLESLVGNLKRFRIKAVGIGAPGLVDLDKGFIYYLPNLTGWENFPLRYILRRNLKLPIFIDNDANVFALAESRLGVARHKSRAIFLTLGTGLGGAVLFERKILRGRVSAAELGHVPIQLDGARCGCGGVGCIETLVGSRYLIKRYAQLKKKKSIVLEVEDIFKKALERDRAALTVWKEFSLSLGKFLAGMIDIFNPQMIVFGGGVSGAFRLFKPLVWQVIKEQAMWPLLRDVTLVKAQLKDAGIIGAALLAKESLSERG